MIFFFASPHTDKLERQHDITRTEQLHDAFPSLMSMFVDCRVSCCCLRALGISFPSYHVRARRFVALASCTQTFRFSLLPSPALSCWLMRCSPPVIYSCPCVRVAFVCVVSPARPVLIHARATTFLFISLISRAHTHTRPLSPPCRVDCCVVLRAPPPSFHVKVGVYVRAKPSYKTGRGRARGSNRRYKAGFFPALKRYHFNVGSILVCLPGVEERFQSC